MVSIHNSSVVNKYFPEKKVAKGNMFQLNERKKESDIYSVFLKKLSLLNNLKLKLDQIYEKQPVYRFMHRDTITNRISYFTCIQAITYDKHD